MVVKAKRLGRVKSKKFFKRNALLSLVIITLIIAFYFFVYNGGQSTFEKKGVLASVNGELIYQQDLDSLWRSLPLQYHISNNQSSLLEQLISEKLLLQEADLEGISVSEADVESFLRKQLKPINKSLEAYKLEFEARNKSFDDELVIIENQLKISKLLDKHFSSKDIMVSDKDVRAVYESKKNSFYQEHYVKVQHILISPSDSLSQKQAYERAKFILEQVADENKDFCSFVQNYSSDRGSVSSCGVYTFKKGEMDSSFENASFSMSVGEFKLINSSMG